MKNVLKIDGWFPDEDEMGFLCGNVQSSKKL